jgi:hypothetical protein
LLWSTVSVKGWILRGYDLLVPSGWGSDLPSFTDGCTQIRSMLERYNRKEHKQATAAKHANGEMLCQLQICDNLALNKGLSAITQLFKDAIDGCDRLA